MCILTYGQLEYISSIGIENKKQKMCRLLHKMMEATRIEYAMVYSHLLNLLSKYIHNQYIPRKTIFYDPINSTIWQMTRMRIHCVCLIL